jgi:hypothetical protein
MASTSTPIDIDQNDRNDYSWQRLIGTARISNDRNDRNTNGLIVMTATPSGTP